MARITPKTKVAGFCAALWPNFTQPLTISATLVSYIRQQRGLARLPDITVSRLPELLPWNWKAEQKAEQEAVKAA